MRTDAQAAGDLVGRQALEHVRHQAWAGSMLIATWLTPVGARGSEP
ncbi:MAG: hypothetical protein JOZ81_14165 [Chloroflexi bacterium]|nr:hypothetical protein [Chloroflexota bacterium]